MLPHGCHKKVHCVIDYLMSCTMITSTAVDHSDQSVASSSHSNIQTSDKILLQNSCIITVFNTVVFEHSADVFVVLYSLVACISYSIVT